MTFRSDNLVNGIVRRAAVMWLAWACAATVAAQTPADDPALDAPLARLQAALIDLQADAPGAVAALLTEVEPRSQRAAAARRLEAWSRTQRSAVQLRAIAALAALVERDATLAPLLVRQLGDGSLAVRQAAFDELVRLEAADARLLGLIVTVYHGDAENRFKAAYYLGRMGSAATLAVEPLAAMARDDSLHVSARWGAVAALRDLGEPGVPGLVEVLNATDKGVAYKSLEALMVLGPKAAEATPAVLAALISDDPQIRFRGAETVAAMGAAAAPARPLVARLLEDPDPQVRASAAKAWAALENAGR